MAISFVQSDFVSNSLIGFLTNRVNAAGLRRIIHCSRYKPARYLFEDFHPKKADFSGVELHQSVANKTAISV